ncbi:Trm112 family protein [Specibacter cremeus]|uniref:Trm112 family protein n=1 Tax=Specibacter cremeus TaxID=1629051 RepID=UPI000F7A8D9A|nr:hypothetical protein [Specibacter cremeus]
MAKISDDLLSILRCPVTGAPLRQDGETLVSTSAGPDGTPPVYRIDDGIVLLLRPDQLATT